MALRASDVAGCGRMRRRNTVSALVAFTTCMVVLYYVLCRGDGWHQPLSSSSGARYTWDRVIQMPDRVKKTPDLDYSATIHRRIARVKEECSRLGNSGTPRDVALYPPESLVVNEEHRVIYCNVPKIGCTNWKKVFLNLGGFDRLNVKSAKHLGPNAKGRIYLDYIHKYTNISHRRFMLQNFTKFMFVRHPFTRILSAFLSKLAPNISFNFRYDDEKQRWLSNYGKIIIQRYRGQEEAERVSSDWHGEYDLKFSEFIRYLVDPDTDSFNKHWSDVYSMCLPCDIEYDFIGKYETLNRDAEHILRLINTDPRIKYPTPVPGTATNSSDPKKMESMYNEVPQTEMVRLAALYANDFELFGYHTQPYLH